MIDLSSCCEGTRVNVYEVAESWQQTTS